VSSWLSKCYSFPAHTCSCSKICLGVGCNATVYQPMNSKEGNTCLSIIRQSVIGIEMVAGIDTYIGLSEIRKKRDQRTLHCPPLSVRRYSQSLLHDRSVFQGGPQALCIDSIQLEIKSCTEQIPKGSWILVCSLLRVRCSEIFKIGRGCLFPMKIWIIFATNT